MHSSEQLTDFITFLNETYDDFAFQGISSRRMRHAELAAHLASFRSEDRLAIVSVGRSAEGREIFSVSFGTGPKRVLLWSQMHGNEPTATLALFDILNVLRKYPERPEIQAVLQNTTVRFVPMLNPDGAERFQRATAQEIDMNRDAAALKTPEARTLKELRDRFEPEFGFNLHDQDPRYTVGDTTEVAAISLLAPPFNHNREDNPVRLRAKRLGAVLARIFATFIPGKIARYTDDYEARAFGDSMQRWGTSTILIESGGMLGDPEKHTIRKLNCLGILGALFAVATDAVEREDLAAYESLPFNSKNLYDMILENVTLTFPDGTPPVIADIGINFDDKEAALGGNKTSSATVMEVGDLRDVAAVERLDGRGRRIAGASVKADAPVDVAGLKDLPV